MLWQTISGIFVRRFFQNGLHWEAEFTILYASPLNNVCKETPFIVSTDYKENGIAVENHY